MQLAGSWRVVGAYDADDAEMIGFAGAVSDGVAFAYLAEVVAVRNRRGRGLGAELVRVMVDAGPGARVRWVWHTGDAHGLYRRSGFHEPDRTFMARPGTPSASADGARPG